MFLKCKIDLSEHGALTAPVIRNGLVLYINYKLTNEYPNETAKIVEKLATGNIKLKSIVHFRSLLASNCQGYEEAPF